ncbi:hypothetical protein EV126DRAFT_69098 [Verticillium dahliae]|nr:hypothetical protein EV126DRAFT_69098 [Verticillium dahliae]
MHDSLILASIVFLFSIRSSMAPHRPCLSVSHEIHIDCFRCIAVWLHRCIIASRRVCSDAAPCDGAVADCIWHHTSVTILWGPPQRDETSVGDGSIAHTTMTTAGSARRSFRVSCELGSCSIEVRSVTRQPTETCGRTM